jgi:hypothetical protein
MAPVAADRRATAPRQLIKSLAVTIKRTGHDGGHFQSGRCFIWVERKVSNLQSLFLVLAELYGKHAFDIGKKGVPEQDAEFMALLGPHTEGLTKRMVTRWLAGWNNANRGRLVSC